MRPRCPAYQGLATVTTPWEEGCLDPRGVSWGEGPESQTASLLLFHKPAGLSSAPQPSLQAYTHTLLSSSLNLVQFLPCAL
jgi:hypothetical protein